MSGMDLLRGGIRQPPLIRQLKKILDQYPDNGQILKEILQNAEDAGAREVKFLVDETHYGEDLGVDPSDPAYPLLGPALYVYNNAKFSDKDWEGIITFGESIKEKDPTSVGKFGLGFKSVFHLTDVPSFYSGAGVGFLDPHRKYLPDKETAYPWYFSQEPDCNCNGQHLFHKEVYQKHNFCSCCWHPQSDYKHTVFRFPLRTENSGSELSHGAYTVEMVKSLLDSLSREAYMNLLFMRKLETIEVQWLRRGRESQELYFKVEITEASLKENVRSQRQKLHSHISNGSIWNTSSLLVTLDMNIKTSTSQGSSKTKWSVCHCIDGGTNQSILQSLAEEGEVGLLPWTGVAVILEDDSRIEHVHGHIFSFLPLPLTHDGRSLTGLPVHVHGHFALDQNRHNIKWPTADEEGQIRDKSVLWNMALVTETMPKAYIGLLHHLKELQLPHKVVLCMPSSEKTVSPWSTILDAIYNEIGRSSYFVSVSASRGQNIWLRSTETYLVPHHGQLRDHTMKVLCQTSQNVVDLPKETEETLLRFGIPFKQVILTQFRNLLKRPTALSKFNETEKIDILQYILQDEQYHDLHGIPLLPLADGSFTTFRRRGQQTVYISTEAFDVFDLLPGTQNYFVDAEALHHAWWQRMIDCGQVQLERFSPAAFKMLLPGVLNTSPGLGEKPVLWGYLRENFYHSLEEFSGMKLIPVTTKFGREILPIVRDQPWLIVNSDYTDGVKSCLEALGIKLILSVDNQVMQHGCICNNVLFWNSEGLQKCLERVQPSAVRKFGALHPNQRRQLCEFLSYQIDGYMYLSQKTQQILSMLPMFQDLREGYTQLVSAQEAQWKACAETPPYDIKSVILHTGTGNEDKSLVSLLSVTTLTLSTILQTCILANFQTLSETEKSRWIHYILENMQSLQSQDYRIFTALQNLSFVKTNSGRRKMPSELFSAECPELKSLGNTDSDFPCSAYQKFHEELLNLGMKTSSSVTADDIQHFVQQIERLANEVKKEKVTALITLLNKRVELLTNCCSTGQSLWSSLACFRWIPVQSKAPDIYPPSLPWKGSKTSYATPEEVVLTTTDNIYSRGGVCLMVNQEYPIAHSISNRFSWNRSPESQEVLKQLQLMKHYYREVDQASYTLAVEHVYRSLQKCYLNQNELKLLSNLLWMGNGFSDVDVLVELPPVKEMKPYIYQIPDNFHNFAPLYKQCGVKQTCDPLVVLQRIKSYHQHQRSSHEEERDRKLSVALLEYVAESEFSGCKENILLPIQSERLQLLPFASCTYHKKQWKQIISPESVGLPDGTFLVHRDVPEKTIKQLQVKPLAAQKLKAQNLEFEMFGQNEPLPLRIHNILKNYKDGFAVPKELIQNADDAGATEVKILYDQRENRDARTSLFDVGMEECQGPALWAFNNSQFSEEDFQNIIRLGSGSKEYKNNTVGRFGLGFNSVYNLTDVPSFISGNHLVIFDPHTKYLDECLADQRSPGVRVEISEMKVSDFKDQFRTYDGIFDCNILSSKSKNISYPGTLFRFPLRTKKQAESSEISKLSYDKHEAAELLIKLVEGGSSLLLFTQHVRSVSVFLLEDGQLPSMMKCMVHISKNCAQILDGMPSFIDNSLVQAAEFIRKGKREQLCAAFILNTSVHLTEEGKRFLRITSSNTEKNWLICNMLGTRSSFDMATKKRNLVPFTGIALRILKDRNVYKPVSEPGQLFCFLPLPILTGLPLHVNGFFFQ